MSHLTQSETPARRLRLAPFGLDRRQGAILVTLSLAGLLAIASHGAGGVKVALACLIGLAMGAALMHASFGFSAGYRALFSFGRTAHVRAQLVLLALTTLAFLPLIALGSFGEQALRGFVFPAGLATVIGAFLFGIGMQIGGGCGSGVLYTAGAGGTRMILTLVFFVVGATLAAFTVETWRDLPALPALSLSQTFGWPAALALSLALFGLAYLALARLERRNTGAMAPIATTPDHARPRLLSGPWPLLWGALALAALNVATLVVLGRPWAITQSFALVGSQIVDRVGFDDPTFWAYWEDPTRVDLLQRPLLADAMTVMNTGILLGAVLAAAVAGRFAPTLKVSAPHAAASALGGLLLGYGAVMATGCNISAFVSGVASGSLHGYVWIAAALPGAWLGVRLRPLFRLA